jgi:uncharacterized protein (TIGR00290 family)
MKVISLWSGGKDSCFAYYKAKLRGYKIISLFNFTNSNGANSISHGLSSQIIRKQAIMTGIPLFQKAMSNEDYEKDFKALILKVKRSEGIRGIVFGDIYLREHKDWIDRVCKEIDVEPVMPLWGKDTSRLVNEFIKRGFKAIIVSTRKELLGKEWLGREINTELVEEFQKMGNIDLCGEKGEFHTFVYDGPVFKNPVKFITGKKTLKDNHWFLELAPKERGGW